MSFASLVSLPQRSSWTVCGEVREVLFWPCTGIRPRAVLLMIPGNPGLIDFYIDFCNELHAKFKKDLDIIGTSHLGHTLFSDNRGQQYRSTKTYSLEDQVTNTLAMFDIIDQTYGTEERPRMLLCGHSIGSYMAQRIVAVRTDRVARVFSLFPTVDKIADTPRGRQLRVLFRPGVRQVVAGIIDVLRWLLPTSTIVRLASLSKSLGDTNTRVVVDKMLHGSCVNSVLTMAADEMRRIVDLDEELYASTGGKFVMYYGTDDMWVPEDRYERMRAVNTQGVVRLCSGGISHAFVTAHSAEMACVVIGMLTDELAAEIENS
ncbi:hypothetical protein GGH99_000602 [Coemansia sp. RSA 1285]|nr:hypothetical protein GGH99_000602 [Coemansia sp. RSA 1285]